MHLNGYWPKVRVHFTGNELHYIRLLTLLIWSNDLEELPVIFSKKITKCGNLQVFYMDNRSTMSHVCLFPNRKQYQVRLQQPVRPLQYNETFFLFTFETSYPFIHVAYRIFGVDSYNNMGDSQVHRSMYGSKYQFVTLRFQSKYLF